MSDFHCATGDWYKSAVFSCQESCARVESVAPNYSVPLHNLRCYNTQNKELVCLYMPNRTIGVVSLAGHYMAVIS